MSDTIIITPADGVRTSRGFRHYAQFRCTYDREVAVYESSAAEASRVWVSVTGTVHLTGEVQSHPGTSGVAPGYAAAHLDRDGAERLRDALSAWLESEGAE